jgi:DNA polymerase III alpha subunit
MTAKELARRGIESGKTGTHGSKVVITKGDDLYLRYQKNGQVIALIDRITAEQLISLDFLANWGLTLVSRVIERTGVEKVPENDVRTLRMLFEGNSIGVPYLETTWLMEVLGKIGKAIDLERVTEDDLAVAFALSRPAAAGLIDEYVKRRLNPDEIVHIHPVVDEILGESANLVVYQEQTLALAERIGQMDESEREGLRKAISKERGWGVIEKYQEKFVTNATAMGIETEAAVDLFDQIANFGSYGFLEGHVRELMQEIFYPAAYLKRHFPKEFLQEVINLEQSSYFWMGIPEVFVWEADRMGVRVKLKPKGKKGKNGNPIDDEAD